MTYSINAVTRRVVLSGSAGTGPYAFTFEILDDDDIQVYKDTTLLTKTTDYTVTISANGTGSVTLNTGTTNVPSAPTSSNTITVIGSRDIERTTDFVTAGDLLASSLNEQLDSLTIFDQQVAEEQKRSLQAPVFDPAHVDDGGILDMTLPAKASRAGKYLSFNTDGNPIASAGTADATPISAALNTFVQSASVAAARAELLTGSNLTFPNDAFNDSTIQSTGDIQLTPNATGKVFVTTDNAESFQSGNVKIEDNLISAANAQGELRLEPNGAAPLLINGTAAVTEDSSTGTILSVHGTSTQGMMELVSHASANSASDVGKIQFNMSNNDATFKRCAEIAVTTDGATNSRRGGNILFKTRDNNSTAMSERVRIDRGGNVYIGGTNAVISASAKLGVHGRIDASNTSNAVLALNRSGVDGVVIDFGNDGTFGIGNVSVSGSSVSFNSSSDHRLKENVADMTGAIARVKQLAPKRFNFIVDADKTVDGFLAHEAQTVVPEAVTGTHNEVDDDGNAVMQGIDQSKLVPLLTGALQEAIAKIEALEARVTTLENA